MELPLSYVPASDKKESLEATNAKLYKVAILAALPWRDCERVDLNLLGSTSIQTVLELALDSMQIVKEPTSNFYLFHGQTLTWLPTSSTICEYADLLLELRLRRTAKSELEMAQAMLGRELPNNLVAIEDTNDQAAPLQEFALKAAKDVKAIVPSEICQVVASAQQSADELACISLTAQLNPREPLVEHVDIHFAGDKKDFDIDLFKKSVAADLSCDPNDVAVLYVKEGGSFFVGFTLKIDKAVKATKEEVKRVKAKMKCYTYQMADNADDAFANLRECAKTFAKDKPAVALAELGAKLIKKKRPASKMFSFSQREDLIKMSEMLPVQSMQAKDWMKEQMVRVESTLRSMLQHSHYEFVVHDIALILNEQLQEDFAEKCDQAPCELLFHGTRTDNFGGIFSQGFLSAKQGQTDKGYYGRGYYFTSFPEYALQYSNQSICVDEPVNLMASYVCLGNRYEVKDMSFVGATSLKTGYDSHYVRVVAPEHEPLAMHPGNEAKHCIYDEYVVNESWRVLPMYVITLRRVPKAFIWRDPKIMNEENQALFAVLKTKLDRNIYLATTTEQVIQMVKTKLKGRLCQPFVITNGADNGNELVRVLREEVQLTNPMLVYCMNTTFHKQWASKFSDVLVTRSETEVVQWIHKHADSEV